MPPLSEEAIFRLLLAKALLERTRGHSVADADSFFVAQQVLTAHDAAELALAAVAEHLQAQPSQQYLMQYIAALEQKLGVSIEGKGFLMQLNQARIGLKHYGNLPESKQWIRVTDKTHDIVTKWCEDLLGISFVELDQSSLLRLTELREHYRLARVERIQGQYEQALVTLGKAIHILFRENSALRGFRAGLARPEDAIKLAGFGVHGNDYLALQEFLPTVIEDDQTGKLTHRWKQSQFGHPGNWRENTVDFCLRVSLDIAIKLQRAGWIPGAIAFDLVYDYKITAVRDGVEISAEIAEPAEQLEVKILNKGEALRLDYFRFDSNKPLKDLLMKRFLKDESESEPETFSIGLFKPSTFFGKVAVADVKVTCLPRDTEFVKTHFPNLGEIEWKPDNPKAS